MMWSGGPRAWTLSEGGGEITLAQVLLDVNNHYQVYVYTPVGREIWCGGGMGSTLELAKKTAELVARRHNPPLESGGLENEKATAI